MVELKTSFIHMTNLYVLRGIFDRPFKEHHRYRNVYKEALDDLFPLLVPLVDVEISRLNNHYSFDHLVIFLAQVGRTPMVYTAYLLTAKDDEQATLQDLPVGTCGWVIYDRIL